MQSDSVVTSSETNPQTQPSSASPTPISEFAGRDDFPECLRGQLVDIGGYAGTVTDIVRNSVKVRSAEGTTMSFNFHALRKLYGPRVEIEAQPDSRNNTAAEPATEQAEEKKDVVFEPDFSAPVQPITAFTGRSDYPKCLLGQHVDVAGFKGVVIELVDRSLKVRSQEETTRRYNSDMLRKLHPPEK